MANLQLKRNSVLFEGRDAVLVKWEDAEFLDGLKDGELIVARYTENGGADIYAMLGTYVEEEGTIKEIDSSYVERLLGAGFSETNTVQKELTNIKDSIKLITSGTTGNLADIAEQIVNVGNEVSNLSDELDTVSGNVITISGDIVTMGDKLDAVSASTKSLEGTVNTLAGDIEDVAYYLGLEDYEYKPNQNNSIISGASTVAEAVEKVAIETAKKVSSVTYDSTKHQLIVDGTGIDLATGQLLSEMAYDAETNKLTLYYKNETGAQNEVNIDMTKLVEDAVNTVSHDYGEY